ncbi:MAG TPA: ribbon-helix-helix protein, CopG family [Terracidiphilus sp.]|jgi:metal-responsive CopG/Arc/MetJ family transcriptional regulator
MQIIQVVLDEQLLRAADEAAGRTNQNRSALMREALREHLRRLESRAMEERERAGYEKFPQTQEEEGVWEAETAWPAE